MREQETDTLYRKKGRRYVPAYSARDWSSYDNDLMRPGTFRLTYAYSDGGRRYEYDVTPDTASFLAAAMLAKHAMTEALRDAAKMKPSGIHKFSARERKLIAEFRAAMGMNYPLWWREGTADEVASAGVDAVRNWAKEPSDEAQ